jgi:hypothetical protein
MAQPFAIGVKGGVRPTSDFEGGSASESKRYLIGLMLELGLPRNFAVEGNALYSRIGYNNTGTDIIGDLNIERARSNSWEFPLVLKYRFHAPHVRPYLLGGYAVRFANGSTTETGTFLTSGYSLPVIRVPYRYSYSTHWGLDHGPVVGAGLEWGEGRVRIAPEVRYVRWKDPLYSFEGSRGYYGMATQNEVQVLVGVNFH